MNLASGNVLDISAGGPGRISGHVNQFFARDGTAICSAPLQIGSELQMWTVKGEFLHRPCQIINVATETCIDLQGGSNKNGTPVVGWKNMKGNMNQHWEFKPIRRIEIGEYYLENVKAGTFLDIEKGGENNGTPVQGWKKLSSPAKTNQLFRFEPCYRLCTGQERVYYIVHVKSKNVLDLNGGDRKNGTKVQMWKRSPGENKNQLWLVRGVPGRKVSHIVNFASKTALDLSGGNSENGTKVFGWSYGKENPNQMWKFSKK